MKHKGLIKYSIIIILIILISIVFIPGIFTSLKYGLDLQGGFEVLYQVSSLDDEKLTSDMLNNTYKTLIRRIDALGVSEPVITIEGDDKIRVQLAGVTDQEEARNTLGQVATLTFRDSSDNLLMTSDVLSSGGASIGQDNTGMPAVALGISKKDEFYRVTNKISKTEDQLIVIWLDFEEGVDSYANEKDKCGTEASRCLSAATVKQAFSSDVVIQGHFTTDEVKTLVTLINSGSLPTKLDEISSKTVTASFGEGSLEKTYVAGIIGILLVIIFMTIMYRFSGFISSVGLLIYTVVSFGIFWLIGGVLTLPGIAAMLLGIGMAVDANVLNFSRIKDELANRSSLESAFKKGNTNSLKTIVDANITTLLVAIILFIFGESSVKGFATMLIISIFVTMLVMVVITRLLTRKFVETGFFDDKIGFFIGKPKAKKAKFDSVKISKICFIVTTICIVGGCISLFVNGLNLGIDFRGGTLVTVSNATKAQVEEELKDYKVVDIEDGEQISARLNENLTKDQITELTKTFEEKYEASTDIDVVSNMIKRELIKNAIYSVLLAILGMIIYISFRFRFSYGISSIIALAHDVLLVFIIFSLLKFEVASIFVAAILSIIGYSINNTIVVFDRIRENSHKKEIKTYDELKDIVNKSISSTARRSIYTTITTMIPVICLIIFGSSEILYFNIALLIGLIVGTYSSLLLAPNIWLLIEKRTIGKPKKKKWYEEDTLEEKSIKGVNS